MSVILSSHPIQLSCSVILFSHPVKHTGGGQGGSAAWLLNWQEGSHLPASA